MLSDEYHAPYWRQMNIGSGNGLVPPCNDPVPVPMLTQIYGAMLCH